MGAMFEVSIISKRFIPFQASIRYLQRLGAPFSPEKLQSIQDWAWTGQHDLDLDIERQDVKPLLEAGRIVLLYGTLGEENAGVFVKQNVDGTFQTDLWFDESFYPHIKIHMPLGCKEFYEKLEALLEDELTSFYSYEMVLAVMGEEIVFEYSPDLETTREHCRVDRWITPRQGDSSSGDR